MATDKHLILPKQQAFMEACKGTDYSQEYRLRGYPGGSMDCSTAEWFSWLFAGCPLVNANGEELTFAAAQMQARNFEVIRQYTDTPSPISAATSYGAEQGDIIGYSFKKNGRYLNCSHIASVRNKSEIIHTANNTEKFCVRELTWGAGRVIQIMRLKDNVTFTRFGQVERGSRGISVRALQLNANIYANTKLNVDGIAGTKTMDGMMELKAKMGLGSSGIWTVDNWGVFYGGQELTPQPAPSPKPQHPYPGRILKKTGTPYRYDEYVAMLQARLNELGYSVGKADGKFGPATEKGVKKFQTAGIKKGLNMGVAYNNNKADGKVGIETWTRLWE